jgi:hypothetical protein
MRRADNQGSIALIVAETITSGMGHSDKSGVRPARALIPTPDIALQRANRRFVPTNEVR